MSTVIRTSDGKIKLYTKGADTVILERLSKNQPYTEKTLAHLEVRIALLTATKLLTTVYIGLCFGRPPNSLYCIP